MNFRVCGRTSGKTGLFDAVDIIEGHSFSGSVEDCRLVHVIPEAGNSILNKLFIEPAPPVAGLGASEIGKYRRAGPHHADIFAAIGLLHKVIASRA